MRHVGGAPLDERPAHAHTNTTAVGRERVCEGPAGGPLTPKPTHVVPSPSTAAGYAEPPGSAGWASAESFRSEMEWTIHP
jgi:hypothetical protein